MRYPDGQTGIHYYSSIRIPSSFFFLFLFFYPPRTQQNKPDDNMAVSSTKQLPVALEYIQYEHRLESQYLPAIRALISKDLSEPYSIYVYRYFLCQWSHLCFMVSLPLSVRRKS